MGTSKDIGGPTRPEWSRVKRRATKFANEGGHDAAGLLLGALAAALGGAAAGVRESPSAVSTGQALTNFLAGVGESGAIPTLEELGLEALVGQPRLEVLSRLADEFSGDGATLEQVAARQAAIFVLDQTLPEGGDLGTFTMDAEAVAAALRMFVARYIYCRLAVLLDQRLAQLDDPDERTMRDNEIWDYILTATRLHLADVDVLSTDWKSDEGKQVIEALLADLYGDFEAGI